MASALLVSFSSTWLFPTGVSDYLAAFALATYASRLTENMTVRQS
jgi:hypothetical protein